MNNAQFFDFIIDDVIHDVINLMNLGNKHKITNFIVFSKSYFFIINWCFICYSNLKQEKYSL